MSAARDEILVTVRGNLERSGRPARPQSAAAPRRERPAAAPDPAELARRFKEVLEGVGGHVWSAANEREVARHLRRILGDGRRLALTEACTPLLPPLRNVLPEAEILEAPDREVLLETDVGVTAAQWGIAETGTLILASAAERHRLVSLLPPVHVAILETSRILETLGDALITMAGEEGPGSSAPPSRAYTLVTGPSRTADIELTLVVGVHGPRELHVIFIENSH